MLLRFLKGILLAIWFGFIAYLGVGLLLYPFWWLIFGFEGMAVQVYNAIVIMSGLIGMVKGFTKPIRAEAQKWREARAKERARLQYEEEEQKRYYDRMYDLGEQSLGTFGLMPRYLEEAEEYLDRAEEEFEERAFAPFWSSAENAAKSLAHFYEAINNIQENISQYSELVDEYKGTPPRFPFTRESLKKLTVGEETAERMRAIVRKAQRDFKFAVIYEQRKTNQILIAGFNNLGQALEQMTSRIVSSIGSLGDSINAMAEKIDVSIRSLGSDIDDFKDTAAKQGKKQEDREREILGKLDKIRRGRR